MSYVRDELKIDRKTRARTPTTHRDERDPKKRVSNFCEVKLGFDSEDAIIEAQRCIQCPDPAPCIVACPLDNDIPGALWELEQGDFLAAAAVFRKTSTLPEMCSRVCPQDKLCEGSCTIGAIGKPVAIGLLERFATDHEREILGDAPVPDIAPSTGTHIAVVGSGPAGLSCAENLAILGHKVTVYEAWPEPGGLLKYGIPNFKLEKEHVERKVAWMTANLGIEFVCNTRIGEDVTVDELLEQGFDAVFLGIGAGIEATINLPGEDLEGVYSSTDFLVRANLALEELPNHQRARPDIGDTVAIIGGGYTATDCVRTSVRLGTKATIYYRRTQAEMPGSMAELKLGLSEGALVEFLTAPIEFIDADGDGRVDGMKVIRMKLGEPDDSGRRRPVPIEGSEEIIPVTGVVLAIGYWPDPLISETTADLESYKYGLITVDETTGQTSRKEIFAGGDATIGPDLVVTAAAHGRQAAQSIHQLLMEKVPA